MGKRFYGTGGRYGDLLTIGGKPYITTREAGELTGRSMVYIRKLIRSGEIEAITNGHPWLVDLESLLDRLPISREP